MYGSFFLKKRAVSKSMGLGGGEECKCEQVGKGGRAEKISMYM